MRRAFCRNAALEESKGGDFVAAVARATAGKVLIFLDFCFNRALAGAG